MVGVGRPFDIYWTAFFIIPQCVCFLIYGLGLTITGVGISVAARLPILDIVGIRDFKTIKYPESNPSFYLVRGFLSGYT
jgi:hypothetical protein